MERAWDDLDQNHLLAYVIGRSELTANSLTKYDCWRYGCKLNSAAVAVLYRLLELMIHPIDLKFLAFIISLGVGTFKRIREIS